MRTDPIADGWGAYWIDDLVCDWCDQEWPGSVPPYGELDDRQYITINIEPYYKRNTLDPEHIHLCPQCAGDLADRIAELLDEDVPMGMRPEDTEDMCALPDDFYLWRNIDDMWWDDDTKRVRDAEGNEVRYPKGNRYKLAMKQRKPYQARIDKFRR